MKEYRINIDLLTTTMICGLLLLLCRGLKFANIYCMIFVLLVLLLIVISKRKIRISKYDILLFTSIGITLLHRYKGYSYVDIVFYSIAFLIYLICRWKDDIFTMLKVIASCSIINLISNGLYFVFPEMYNKVRVLLFTRDYYENAIKNISVSPIMGLTDHYSRNAYFCVLGALLFFALAYSSKKRRVIFSIISFVFLSMIMVIGKRGHFFFSLASILIFFLLTSENFSKGLKRIMYAGIILLLIFGVAIEVIPQISYIIDRTISLTGSEDFSSGRLYLWKTGWNRFLEKPLLGWGHGYVTSTMKTGILGKSYAGMHNDYLQWLVENGIVGFFINILPMFGIFHMSVKELRRIAIDSENSDSIELKLIVWSVLFQMFIILYSLTGLPHYDREVFVVYYLSLAVPYALAE